MERLSAQKVISCEEEHADCSQRTGSADATWHDTQHMAQIWGSGPRTLQKPLENMARL